MDRLQLRRRGRGRRWLLLLLLLLLRKGAACEPSGLPHAANEGAGDCGRVGAARRLAGPHELAIPQRLGQRVVVAAGGAQGYV